MQTLKKLALTAALAFALAGMAVGATTALSTSDTVIADSSGQRGDLDAG